MSLWWAVGRTLPSTHCPESPGGLESWILFLELDSDPYDPEEEDPARSRALESCLWELQVGLGPEGTR